MDPHNAVPYSRRGEAYLYEGDFERAIDDLTEAIAISPAIALNYSNRAEARARKGDLDGALADCDEARRRDPKEPLSHVYRAYVLGKTGRLAEADAELAEAFKLSPGEPDAILYRGELEMMEQAPGKALVDFEAALAKSPQNPFALSGRGAARRALEARPALSGDAAGIRVALVIGNAHYAAQAPLANPPNDASAIAEGLRGSGFQHVTVALDLTREGIVKALHEFQDEADKADWALVYFSGHGLEVGGVNYVLPVDAHVTSDRDVADEAISLDRLVAGVSGARKIKIVILDACRENPFAASMRRSAGTRSVTRGLAPIEPVGATLVVYAAKDGEVAQDGDGANSPFAAALAKHLAEPHLELTKLFRLVTADVLDATDRKQQPFVYGSVGRDDFYFRP
jgi:tetratricopeptide (TPR) repeat protein